MPRKKVVKIEETDVTEPAAVEPTQPEAEAAKPSSVPETPQAPPPAPAPAPVAAPEPPAKRKRAPAKKKETRSKVIRKTNQQMKKQQEIEYLVNRISMELKKDGWGSYPQQQQQQQQPSNEAYSPNAPTERRSTKQMDLKEVLRRHKVPYKPRAKNVRAEQYVQEEDFGDELVKEETEEEDDDESEAEDDEIMFQVPKAKRFQPKTDEHVQRVYSQMFY